MDLLSLIPADLRRVLYTRHVLAGKLGMLARVYRDETKNIVSSWRDVLPITGEELVTYIRRTIADGAEDTLEFSVLHLLETFEDVIPFVWKSERDTAMARKTLEAVRDLLAKLGRDREVVLTRDDTLKVLRRRGLGCRCERVYESILRRQLDRSMSGMFCDVQAWLGRRLLPGTLTPDHANPWSREEKAANRERVEGHASSFLSHLAPNRVPTHTRLLALRIIGHPESLNVTFPDDATMRAYSSLEVLDRVYRSALYTRHLLDQATATLSAVVEVQGGGVNEEERTSVRAVERKLHLVEDVLGMYDATVIRLSGVSYSLDAAAVRDFSQQYLCGVVGRRRWS